MSGVVFDWVFNTPLEKQVIYQTIQHFPKTIGQISHNSNSNVRISTGELPSLLQQGATPVIQRATVRSVTGHAGCLQVFLKKTPAKVSSCEFCNIFKNI